MQDDNLATDKITLRIANQQSVVDLPQSASLNEYFKNAEQKSND